MVVSSHVCPVGRLATGACASGSARTLLASFSAVTLEAKSQYQASAQSPGHPPYYVGLAHVGAALAGGCNATLHHLRITRGDAGDGVIPSTDYVWVTSRPHIRGVIGCIPIFLACPNSLTAKGRSCSPPHALRTRLPLRGKPGQLRRRRPRTDTYDKGNARISISPCEHLLQTLEPFQGQSCVDCRIQVDASLPSLENVYILTRCCCSGE